MRINIVLNEKNWCLENIARHFHKYIEGSTLSFMEADDTSDVNIYISYHGFTRKTKFDVCYFTHIENKAWWEKAVAHSDLAMVMGHKYADTVPEEKRFIFDTPPFDWYINDRKTKFLVVGREYSSGRKNYNLAHKIAEMPFVDVTFTNGELSDEELIEAYKSTDYVLVTSTVEGGPLCVVEAIAMGKPVIAPDTGWCWEFPCIKYSNETELFKIVSQLHIPRNAWASEVGRLTSRIKKMLTKKSLEAVRGRMFALGM